MFMPAPLIKNHYNYENDCNETVTKENEQQDCFICLETVDDRRTQDITTLKNNSIYHTECECVGLVHKSCLEKWVLLSSNPPKCPICRTRIYCKQYIKHYVFVIEYTDYLMYVNFVGQVIYPIYIGVSLIAFIVTSLLVLSASIEWLMFLLTS